MFHKKLGFFLLFSLHCSDVVCFYLKIILNDTKVCYIIHTLAVRKTKSKRQDMGINKTGISLMNGFSVDFFF